MLPTTLFILHSGSEYSSPSYFTSSSHHILTLTHTPSLPPSLPPSQLDTSQRDVLSRRTTEALYLHGRLRRSQLSLDSIRIRTNTRRERCVPTLTSLSPSPPLPLSLFDSVFTFWLIHENVDLMPTVYISFYSILPSICARSTKQRLSNPCVQRDLMNSVVVL